MSDSPVSISVVLPTHNGESLLRRALRPLVTQTLPASEYEVIVVDNGSTDGTRAILDEFSRMHGVLHLQESRLGAAVARNTGWRAARGEWVAFVDDDVSVPPDWLESILESIASSDATVACVGGPVRPIWEASRPPWLHDGLLWSLSIIDWGDMRRELVDVPQEWLVSANMAVRRDTLQELGGFHPDLDKIGDRHLGNGETHLQRRLISAGHVCIFDPEVSVEHCVRATRLTQAWFLSRCYQQGLSDFAVGLIDSNIGMWRRCYTAAGMMFRLTGSGRNLAVLLTATEDPSEFRRKCHLVVKAGYIAGLMGALGR